MTVQPLNYRAFKSLRVGRNLVKIYSEDSAYFLPCEYFGEEIVFSRAAIYSEVNGKKTPLSKEEQEQVAIMVTSLANYYLPL